MAKQLTPSEATKRIREIVRFGDVRTTEHCRIRMVERRFSFQDLVSVLLNGDVKSQPEYDQKHDQFKYRVEGNTIDGDSAAAITVIVSARTLLVVTIFEGAGLESS